MEDKVLVQLLLAAFRSPELGPKVFHQVGGTYRSSGRPLRDGGTYQAQYKYSTVINAVLVSIKSGCFGSVSSQRGIRLELWECVEKFEKQLDGKTNIFQNILCLCAALHSSKIYVCLFLFFFLSPHL